MSKNNDADNVFRYNEFIQDKKVHSSLYTDGGVFEDEMNKIFREGWVFVCHESEIPNTGDFVRRQLGNDLVFAIRNPDGGVSVIENRCSHRGNIICLEEKGNKKALVCQYHGWAFNTKGDLIDVPHPEGFKSDFSCSSLKTMPKVEDYRGFIFGSFNNDVPLLSEHLGRASELIDRAVEMSPVGKLNLTAGWIKHRVGCNWKMMPENDTDGYHVSFVHPSFAQAIRSNYDAAVLEAEEDLKSESKAWGNGHTELYFSPAYNHELEWFGCKEGRYPNYTKAIKSAYGDKLGGEKLVEGPPHAVIFPNLFLGEMNIVIFQPLSPTTCLHIHTPMLLVGVDDDVNNRIVRQSEGALGPTGFLLADDSVIAERTQNAIQGKGGWLDLSRGIEREYVDATGIPTSHLTDETPNRGFWKHYKTVMLAE